VLKATPGEFRASSAELSDVPPADIPAREDRGRATIDHEILAQRLDHESGVIQDVEAALNKLTCGVYGRCEQCGPQISAKRLKVVPWTRLCLTCQSNYKTVTMPRDPTELVA